jgi:hypothetical protein
MAQLKKTNGDGYLAVIRHLEKQGHKFPKAALARMLGYSRQSVDNWNGIVPESQALKVSILTGIPIETIRPETVKTAIKLKEIADEEAEASRQAREAREETQGR